MKGRDAHRAAARGTSKPEGAEGRRLLVRGRAPRSARQGRAPGCRARGGASRRGRQPCALIENDRTQRVDKNYEKFRRYDAFLCWWSMHTGYGDGELPFVIFICQDDDQRDRFLAAADHELTGHLWHPSRRADPHHSSAERAAALGLFLDFYNHCRAHRGINGRAPAVKLSGLMNVAGANT